MSLNGLESNINFQASFQRTFLIYVYSKLPNLKLAGTPDQCTKVEKKKFIQKVILSLGQNNVD